MKLQTGIIIITIAVLFSTACGNLSGCGSGKGEDRSISPGEKKVFSADGLSFRMVYVPGKEFPSGEDDSAVSLVEHSFLTGETLVTWELWKTVYDWAVTEGGYRFENSGRCGGDKRWGSSDPAGSGRHPVTMINWRDAVVWCNALTGWYNSKNGTDYTAVYRYNGEPATDSRASGFRVPERFRADGKDSGFRLPFSDEWELAARWRNDEVNTVEGYKNPWFTKGNSASGASSPCGADNSDTGDFAVYIENSDGKTAEVKSRKPNALGIYDMSGSLFEWTFDKHPDSSSHRITRGGHWNYPAEYLRIGYIHKNKPGTADTGIGFRIAK